MLVRANSPAVPSVPPAGESAALRQTVQETVQEWPSEPAMGQTRRLLGTQRPRRPSFAFAQDFTVREVLQSPARASAFLGQYLDQEANYFDVARHPVTGLTWDGVNLDPRTGQVSDVRPHSAPSKESLDIALLIKALEGDPRAARVVARGDLEKAKARAAAILAQKIDAYETFRAKYPGYAGFMPWFRQDEAGTIEPTPDWVGDSPGLDNGEWLWSLLLAQRSLEKAGYSELAQRYGAYNDHIQSKVVEAYFDREAGKVRGDVHIVDPSSADTAYETIHGKPGRATYLTGEHGVHEGMMLVLYITLFGQGISQEEKERLWRDIPFERVEHTYGTTWEGFWGSAHESWAFLFLPLRKNQGFRDLFRIREKIRTHNAAQRGYPGFATSTNAPGDDGWVGYLDGAGIEGVGTQAIRNNHVYALYGAFPLLLEHYNPDDAATGNTGLAWLLNMLQAPKAQGPLGGGESGTNDGTAISPTKTVDGTLPNLLALMGGVENEMAELLEERGLLEEFLAFAEREVQEVLKDKPLREPNDYALPTAKVPQRLPPFEES